MGLDEIAESEGLDRSNLRLAQNQVDLLQAVAAVNPKIVVVLYSGSVVETPWLDNCQALLYAALGGQAGAGAVADALTGKVNPCGKLAETWPLAYADVPSAADFATRRKTAEYREGLYIGYRYFTTAEKAVRFPFGYGMSYTTFAYSDMAADEQGVSLTVTNTGSVAGTEIVQLYVAKKNSELFRPARELKGFARVTLAPGEKQRITIALDDKAFRFRNVKANRWEIEGGEYELSVQAWRTSGCAKKSPCMERLPCIRMRIRAWIAIIKGMCCTFPMQTLKSCWGIPSRTAKPKLTAI